MLVKTQGPPPLKMPAVSWISASGDKEAPVPRPGRARSAVAGNAYRASTVLGGPLQGQMGQSRLHPRPPGDAAAPTARVASLPGPLHPAVSQRPSHRGLVCKSQCTHRLVFTLEERDACTSRAAGFAAKEGGGWCCEPVTVSRTLSTPSISAGDFHLVWKSGQCAPLWPEGLFPRADLQPLHARFGVLAVPSAFDAHITTLTHIYAQ